MQEITTDINWLAVFVGAVFAFVLGWLWYSPKLFGTKWAESVGINLGTSSEMPLALRLTQAIATFFLAWVVGITTAHNALATIIRFTLTIVLLMVASGFSQRKARMQLLWKLASSSQW